MNFFATISIRVPAEVKERLEAQAEEDGVLLPDIVRAAIGVYLRDASVFAKPTKPGILAVDEQGQ